MEYLPTALGCLTALIVFLVIKYRNSKKVYKDPEICSLCENCIVTRHNMKFKDKMITGMTYTLLHDEREDD